MAQSIGRLAEALREHYAVEREVGAGGMATVYLARDLKHRRSVAIKVLRPELAVSVGSDRFLREIEMAAQLQHPHILPVYDSGEAALPRAADAAPSDGRSTILYYVMPFVDGESLRDRLAREPQLPLVEAGRINAEVASALSYAHAHGVVHRDIKPDNIMLSGGHAVVADFGIARALEANPTGSLTGLGISLGTPAYMSPEQATASNEVDGRSDQYSLACVLFEMLAGRAAFSGPTVQAVLTQSITGPRPRVRAAREGIPVALEAAIVRALSTDPAARFPSVSEFAAAATASVTGAVPTQPRPRALRWLAAGGLAAAVLAGGVLYRRPAGAAVVESARTIAVLPFRTSGPGVEVMGEGMVDLLSANLDALADIRTVEPRTVLRRWRKEEGASADLDGALDVGRDVHATAVLLGSAIATGNSVRLTAELYAIDGEKLGQGRVDGPADSVLSLVDDLTVALLREVWRSREPMPSLRAGALTTGSIDALRAYLRGEQLYRRSIFDSATAAFLRATELDSTFALAYYRQAMSQGWIGNYGDRLARDASEKAVRYSSRLPARERSLLVGYKLFQDASVAAVDSMRRFVAAYPRDVDGWYLLGEALMHTRQTIPASPDELRAPFDSVLALDPTLTPAVLHPLEVSLANRDRPRFDRYMARLKEAGSEDEGRLRAFDAAASLAWGGARADSSLLQVYRSVRGDAYGSLMLGLLRDPGLQPDSMIAAGRWAARQLAGKPMAGRAALGHGLMLSAFGRADSLTALAASLLAEPALAQTGMQLLMVPIYTGTATPEQRRLFEAQLARAKPDGILALWMRAALALLDGDAAASRPYLARFRSVPELSPHLGLVADATEAWAMLVAGDTAAGLPKFEAAVKAIGGWQDWQWLTTPLRYQLALALAANPARRADGVRRLQYGNDDIALQPHLHYALGKAHLAAGDRTAAADALGRFVRLWSGADASLQPRVTEARALLSDLAAEPK